MREIPITLAAFNGERLDSDLRAGLGAKYLSFSSYGTDRPITVRLADDTLKADDDQVAAICAAHMPTPLPEHLKEAADAARSEVEWDAAVTALLNATPGEIGAWYDHLASTQRNLMGRGAVNLLIDHERRLRLLERG
jgi:hypothetical protein